MTLFDGLYFGVCACIHRNRLRPSVCVQYCQATRYPLVLILSKPPVSMSLQRLDVHADRFWLLLFVANARHILFALQQPRPLFRLQS